VGYKLNHWQQVDWFELFLQDETKPPKERILTLEEVLGYPKFEEAIQKGLKELNL
jgi:hypothetical protein